MSQAHRVVAAVSAHMVIGGVYAFSVYEPRLTTAHGFSSFLVQSTFGITIGVFSLAMLVAGRLLTRLAPQRLLWVAAVLYGLGYLLTSILNAQLLPTVLGIGVLSGCAIGITYVSALSSAIRTASNRQGVVTGVVTGGFAVGSALLAPLLTLGFERGLSVPTAFLIQGLGGSLLLFAASFGLDHRPLEARAKLAAARGVAAPTFHLWHLGGLFGSSFAGLIVVGGLSSMGGVELGAALVIGFALGNTLGRPLWGLLFDRFGRITAPVALAGLATVVLLLGWSAQSFLRLGLTALVGFFFAAGLVVYAANTARELGAASVGRVYPFTFLAYGAAAIVGPPLAGAFRDATGSTTLGLMVAAVLAFTSSLLLFLTRTAGGVRVVEPEEPSRVVVCREPA